MKQKKWNLIKKKNSLFSSKWKWKKYPKWSITAIIPLYITMFDAGEQRWQQWDNQRCNSMRQACVQRNKTTHLWPFCWEPCRSGCRCRSFLPRHCTGGRETTTHTVREGRERKNRLTHIITCYQLTWFLGKTFSILLKFFCPCSGFYLKTIKKCQERSWILF